MLKDLQGGSGREGEKRGRCRDQGRGRRPFVSCRQDFGLLLSGRDVPRLTCSSLPSGHCLLGSDGGGTQGRDREGCRPEGMGIWARVEAMDAMEAKAVVRNAGWS